jgi:hypothetical protein
MSLSENSGPYFAQPTNPGFWMLGFAAAADEVHSAA